MDVDTEGQISELKQRHAEQVSQLELQLAERISELSSKLRSNVTGSANVQQQKAQQLPAADIAKLRAGTYKDRLYGFNETCWYMNRFFLGFQMYDLTATALVPSLRKFEHILHHTLHVRHLTLR